MGNDLIIIKMVDKYGPALEKLYREDPKKYKEIYDSINSSIKTSLKISNGVPNDIIMCRVIIGSIMKYINGKIAIEDYINNSDDEIAKVLRK